MTPGELFDWAFVIAVSALLGIAVLWLLAWSVFAIVDAWRKR